MTPPADARVGHVAGPVNGIGKPDLPTQLRHSSFSPFSPPKLPAYVTDLIVMSTLEKEPPAAPGASDLLDSLVQDHLQRAAAPRETPEEAAAALEANLLGTAAPSPQPAEISPDGKQGAGRLQQEIASLLAGDPLAEAPVEPSPAVADAGQGALTADPFADFPVAAPPIEQVPPKPGASVPTQNVSSAELEMLLENLHEEPADAGDRALEFGEPAEASAADELLAEMAADAGGPTQIEQPAASSSPDAADEVAAKLSEADGVMAQELAQLMTDKPAAANAPSAPADAAANPMPAELAAAVQNIMDNPVQTAEKSAEPPAAAPESSPAPVQPPNAVPLETPAPVAVAESAANVAAALDTLAESTPRPTAAPPNILVRLWRLFLGVIVMILQIVDMPFGWIKEPDKNVMGMIAFLLLLSGVLLWACARYMATH
jgi:hypothetical protein